MSLGQTLLRLVRATCTIGGSGKHALETAHTRLIVTGAFFALAFGAVGVRLADVTLLPRDEDSKRARAARPEKLDRADVVDRNGLLVATSIATASAHANPKEIGDPAGVARKLASVLPDIDEKQIRDRLASPDRSFVYIRRNLSPRQQYEINRLGIPGIQFQQENRRLYPQGRLLAHVLGFSDVDNNGLAGVEKGLNERLRAGGEPVALSIDTRIQHILRQELDAAVTKFQAIGAAGMVMDIYTGEVLGMVSLPDFDPAAPGESPDDARFNRITLGVYEMGSTFKIFNTAMALDYGTVSVSGGYDAARPISIGRFTIKDDHPMPRWLSVPEIFMYSSNIGSVKMAQDVGVQGQRAFMDKLGLLSPPKFEVPEIGRPQVPQPWRPINLMTISFGHGISVSALQVAAAVSSVMNGGVYVKPTLVKQEEGATLHGTRVIQAKTSETMRKLMRLVVTNGTGRKGDVPGYIVGGKTGTAEKIGARGGYRKNANITSFVAGFPIHNPRYLVMAMLDEPKALKETYGFSTSGWNAAPTGGKIIARVGPLLGVEPYDLNAPDVKAALAVDLAGAGPRAAKTNPMAGATVAPLVPAPPAGASTPVRAQPPQAALRPTPLPVTPVGGSTVAAR